MPVRDRRITRRVATDCFVDVDTIRYSVPHLLVRRTVEVLVGDDEVVVYDGTSVVARHRRGVEPYERVVDAAHFEGIYRRDSHVDKAEEPSAIRRSLDVYEECIGGVP